MLCARSTSLTVSSLLLLLIGAAQGEDAKSPRIDLYGDPLPPGAVMRLGTIRLRHAAADVVFSKDGKQIISCGNNGEVRVWDAGSGALLRRTRLWKPGEREGIVCTSLASDGAIAVAHGKTLYLYDTLTGRERDRLADARMLNFPPRGKKLAVKWPDKKGNGSVRFWDIVEFKKHLTLDFPLPTVLMRAAFAPDGKQLAALGGERTEEELFLWDAITGKLRKRKKFRARMSSLAYAPDGTTLAVGLDERIEAVLLDAASLKEKIVLPVPANIAGRGFIDPLVFSSDGRMLAGAMETRVMKQRAAFCSGI